MNKPVLISMPENERLTTKLAAIVDVDVGGVVVRQFPDGETYLRLETDVSGRVVGLLCTLHSPDEKLMPLIFAANTARELGATGVGLVAPYLAYMRQDCRFHAGEAVASRCFASLLSKQFDWLVTMDPHLHRHASLADIFSIPTHVAHAAPQITQWVRREVPEPLLIGPDRESKQWVSQIARNLDAPYVILQKERRGDFDVEITLPDLTRWKTRTPLLVDDIISTGQTMITILRQIREAQLPAPVCIAIHGLFVRNALEHLAAAGARRVVSTNTIEHRSNEIDIATPLAGELRVALQSATGHLSEVAR